MFVFVSCSVSFIEDGNRCMMFSDATKNLTLFSIIGAIKVSVLCFYGYNFTKKSNSEINRFQIHIFCHIYQQKHASLINCRVWASADFFW